MTLKTRWLHVVKPMMLGLGVLLATGCGVLNPAHQPSVIGSLEGNGNTRRLTPEQIQAQLMRFADLYAVQIAEGADNVAAQVKTPEARMAALRWKLGLGTSVYIDATGVNPVLNVLDTLVLTTLSRMVMEDYGIKTFGDAVLPLVETHRNLETNAWTLAARILKPEQQKELMALIVEWRRKNPEQRAIGSVRFHDFVLATGRAPKAETTSPTSVFSLLFLDPLAGLDSTTAAVQQTRMMGERAMYYTQRLPALLMWQTELLAYQLAAQPESQQLLTNAAQLSKSAEMFARSTEQLPQVIEQQRQAAIQQVFDALAVDDVKMQSLMTNARQTFGAGQEMAGFVNQAIRSLDELLAHISASSTNAVHSSGTTVSRPFDILDYGRAAGEIGTAATKVESLFGALNETEAHWNRLNREASQKAEAVVALAFSRGVTLIVILLAGAVVAGLIFRLLVTRLTFFRDAAPKKDIKQSETKL